MSCKAKLSKKHRYHSRFLIAITGFLCVISFNGALVVRAQEDPNQPAAAKASPAPASPAPVAAGNPKLALTAKDPAIPVEELALLLKPLTLDELQNEAAAWVLLLKTKGQEISKAEIAARRQNLSIDKQKEASAALETAKKALAEAEKAQTGAAPGSSEAKEAAKKLEDAKANLAKAQEAVKESAAAKKDLKEDATLKTALKDAQKKGELETAKEVLEKAKKNRDALKAGSPEYQESTKKIDAFDKAIATLESAKQAQDKTAPNSAAHKEATKKLEEAQKSLLAAQNVVEGKAANAETAKPTNESEDKVNKAEAELKQTEKQTDAAQNPANAGQQKEQLNQTIQKLDQSTAADAQVKKDLLVNVTALQSDQTALIDRLNAVLKELVNKGGDATPYEKYIQALTTIQVDSKDTEGAFVRIVSWLKSDQGGLRWGGNLLKFVLIVVGSVLLSQVLVLIVNSSLKKFGGVSSLLRDFISMTIKRGGLIIGILVGLTALEISLGPVIALVGGATFVLAFALQSNLGNLASGLMLLAYKPFDVGDEVKIGELWGWVDSITLANTRIKGWKAQIYTVPNNTVWTSTIENLTIDEVRRGAFPINVPYETNLRDVPRILEAVVDAHPKTIERPTPTAFLWEYSESSVNFIFAFWTKTEDFWDVWEDLHFEIKEEFDKAGIAIAIPRAEEIQKEWIPPGQKFQLPATESRQTDG